MFEFELDQLVYYMFNNKIHSAPVISRMIVENLHEERAHTDEQKKCWTPFGKAGVHYCTCHGVFPEKDLYESREDLLDSL